MIKRLKIQNFKSIREAEIDLERFTVFVGPNASGKTSILQAVQHLSWATAPSTDPGRLLDFDLQALGRRGSDVPLLIEGEGSWDGVPGHLMLEADAATDAFQAKGEFGGEEVIQVTRKKPSVERQGSPDTVRSIWRGGRFLQLDARLLAEPSVPQGSEPAIESDGTGLTSVLAQMALNQPDEFVGLVATVQAVIPLLQRIRFKLIDIKRWENETITIDGEALQRKVRRQYTGYQMLLDMVGAPDLPASSASEGTLLVLGLIAAIMTPGRPNLILLDDLDRGLHPKAQRELIAQLRRFLERFPDLQILATSHSPFLINQMKPEEVRLTTTRPDGSTRCAPLTSHPDFEEWKDAMRPGEFWSNVGEGWVKALEPASDNA